MQAAGRLGGRSRGLAAARVGEMLSAESVATGI